MQRDPFDYADDVCEVCGENPQGELTYDDAHDYWCCFACLEVLKNIPVEG